MHGCLLNLCSLPWQAAAETVVHGGEDALADRVDVTGTNLDARRDVGFIAVGVVWTVAGSHVQDQTEVSERPCALHVRSKS